MKPFDPALCASIEQREKISQQKATALVPTRTYWKHGYGFAVREDDPEFERKIAEGEEPPQGTATRKLQTVKT